jgi:hypothetical protein
VKVREIAASRSGDKGRVCNVCVFVYDPKDWEVLRDRLTEERVAETYAPLISGSVTRYEVPTLHGLNFVLDDALDTGVSMSLRSDPHGKSYQSLILDIDI